MTVRASLWILALLMALSRAESAPIEAFALQPQIRNVTLSPDDQCVGFISSLGDVSVVMRLDRHAKGSTPMSVAPRRQHIGVLLRSHS